jgi:hypothetical protein
MAQGPRGFVVEHYLPKKFYPRLETEYSNLYYSCGACNSHKGTWPYMKQGGRWIRVADTVPNPCDHVMADHLMIDRGTMDIRHKTKTGEFAFDLLNLGRRAIEHRKLRDLFARQRDVRADLRKRRKFAKKRLRNRKTPEAERKQIVSALAEVEARLLLVEQDFETNFGPPP